MEYFRQSHVNERMTERFAVIIYSFYTANLCLDIVRENWEVWIPVVMFAPVVAGWILFFSSYGDYRIRAAFSAMLMQFTMILYAMYMDDPVREIPVLMATCILVAFYGFPRLLWMTLVALLFIIFYHGVISDTFRILSRENLLNFLFQTGNLVWPGMALFFWMRRQKESYAEMGRMIRVLEETKQSKDDFLSNISHEIRTPVNTICGMSELAMYQENADRRREEISDIRDAGRSLMSLINDILDFTQLQQGRMDLEEEAYSITSTISDIVAMAMARKKGRRIGLIVDCDADIPCRLLGDEKKIRRVIMNLVDNAVKFTEEGSITIGIHVRREDYGINLCVSVKDTGIGMSETSVERLFESFNQVDTGRNRQEGGIGLGLAIARALVLKMNGTLTVRSRPGRGSAVRFVIPQKILEDKPIVQIRNRETLNVAVYMNMEQFHMAYMRDAYGDNITRMLQQLQVKSHLCRSLAELKRREKREGFTHIFIGLAEYREEREYFDTLAGFCKITLIIEAEDEKYIENPNLLRIYRPFYLLPTAGILNGGRGMFKNRRTRGPQRFTAPDAHVLVVDDNVMNIRVLEGLLQEYQMKITYAVSGAEALEHMEKEYFDFVFMDHMMPEMDGIETLRRIRSRLGIYYQKIPVIALTANTAPGSRNMFLEAGFDDFLEKPVEISVLERVLLRNIPGEKLIFQSEKELLPENGAEEGVPVISDLDVAQGMLYCGGKEQYLEILSAYCDSGTKQRQELERLFMQEDWENYTIKVHALKSTMHSIGAGLSASRAKALEEAGRRGDTVYIKAHHLNFIVEHRRILEALGAYFGQSIAEKEEEEVLPATKLPDLDEETFDRLTDQLEQAMYALDGNRMLAILTELGAYRYAGVPLGKRLEPVLKKVEMSDYISAMDTVCDIRDRLRAGK